MKAKKFHDHNQSHNCYYLFLFQSFLALRPNQITWGCFTKYWCLDCKEIQQSILKEISPGCSLEGLMLKLKLQYCGNLMRRADSFEKTLMLGKIEGRRRRECWMASPTQWTWVWVNPGSWWWTGRPGMLRFMGSQRVGHDWATELNWTELMPEPQPCPAIHLPHGRWFSRCGMVPGHP